MLNKLISRLSIDTVCKMYKISKIGFKFHNGRGSIFIEM
ncbi:MAG: hypothetical protein K0R69_2543 [Clostridia bacterium]|jgi:hypothetical protein|nr:hypothetical protein [Clostridia bacterium]